MPRSAVCAAGLVVILCGPAMAGAQPPAVPNMVETPTVKAREMIAMTKLLNQQFFPGHKPADGESTMGRVTCFTCHQGELKPKVAP
jgi:hypothetical protein